MSVSGALAVRGRGSELDLVLRTLRRSRESGAALVVVRGEPGIGKTTLLAEAVTQATRLGYTVGQAAAHDGDRIAPLASLGPALRTGTDPLVTSAEFLDLAPVIEQPLWLAEHLATLLTRRSKRDPLLVVLDDLHWADPLSIFMLRIVPARLAAAPVVWLVATRDIPGGPAELVAASAAGLPVHHLELHPLPEEALQAIAADRLGEPATPPLARALRQTGGNPFLAVQLVDGLLAPGAAQDAGEAVPPGLVGGVRQRLATLSAGSAALVRTGAVLGARFALDDAAWLLHEPVPALTEALAEAIRAGLLVDDGSFIVFRHELLRRAVYEDVPPSARRATHRTIADHLVRTGRGAAEAAPHVLATATPGDAAAAAVLRRAAHDLLDTMSVTSVQLIRQAFALLPEDHPERAAVGQEVVSVLLHAHRREEAAALADQLLDASPPPDTAAALHLSLAPGLWSTGRFGELADRARDERAAGASPALRARLRAYASFLAPGAEIAENGDPAATAAARAAEASRAERGGYYRAALGHYHAAEEAAARAAGTTGALPVVPLRLRRLVVRGHLDQIAAARGELPDGPTGGGVGADSWQAPELAWVRAHLELGAGQLDAATAAATAALRAMDELHDHTLEARARTVLAQVALLRGDLPGAHVQLANVERRGDPAALLRALVADAEGKPAGPATVELAAYADAVWRDEILVHLACAAARTGDEATLRAAAEALADLASRNDGVASLAGAAALAEGLVTGDLAPAVVLLGQAPRALLAARVDEEAGRLALASGDRDSGVPALRRAEQAYTVHGAPAFAGRVRGLLRAAGVRARRQPAAPRPQTGWAALTATERRVARLVADGHTNKSAAAELFLSPSTVNSHLRAVFQKLGVNSRVQLANVVLRTLEGSDRAES
ncbi:ATP-binding protein [Phytohabitans flavus]|uniref:ATP-binding protein n=1 Tax=Phytohabitans flavus TaxID=1076124 RepID=UPI0031E51AFD